MGEHENRRLEERADRYEKIYIELMSASYDGSSPAAIAMGNTLDISANGLRVALNAEVSVGSILQLCIDLEKPQQRINIVGEVKWCRPDREQVGRFLTGFALYEAEGTDIIAWRKIASGLTPNT